VQIEQAKTMQLLQHWPRIFASLVVMRCGRDDVVRSRLSGQILKSLNRTIVNQGKQGENKEKKKKIMTHLLLFRKLKSNCSSGKCTGKRTTSKKTKHDPLKLEIEQKKFKLAVGARANRLKLRLSDSGE
jgi:hypothetical protein